MQKGDPKFISPLSKARGFGTSHTGVSHWWFQRVTAIALMVLLPWFMISLLHHMLSSDVVKIAQWFSSPMHTVGMIALLIALFWHAKLGFQVVVEDYVHTPFSKYVLLLANSFIAVIATVLGIMAILRMHMIDVTSMPM